MSVKKISLGYIGACPHDWDIGAWPITELLQRKPLIYKSLRHWTVSEQETNPEVYHRLPSRINTLIKIK